MSSIYEAPVFQLVYDLIKDVHQVRRKFEKIEKYSLGETLENVLLDLQLCIVDAGHTKHDWKIASIEKAMRSAEKGKILIRLCYDLKQINDRKYISWQESLNKTGCMLGGWKKSI